MYIYIYNICICVLLILTARTSSSLSERQHSIKASVSMELCFRINLTVFLERLLCNPSAIFGTCTGVMFDFTRINKSLYSLLS